MVPPERFGRGDDPPGFGDRLRRRAGEVRAAILLEEAGEIEAAARVFEQVGAHAQAAALRLEHARTERDEDTRRALLRDACARAHGDAPAVRALFRAYAQACLEAARAADAAGRAGHVHQAARALERAGDHEAAGALYERLGRYDDAARCFQAAGDIERMELAMLAQERRRAPEERARAVLADARRHLAAGARLAARRMLDEAALPAFPADARAQAERIVQDLAERWTRPPRVALSLDGAPLDVFVGPHADLGRSPGAAVRLSDPSVSRRHARIHLDARPPTLADLDTQAGTFVDGAALPPGGTVPITGPVEVALALGAALRLRPWGEAGAAIRIDPPPPHPPVLLVPPDVPVPLGTAGPRVAFSAPDADGPLVLSAGPGTVLILAGSGHRVRRIDLLAGDRLRIEAGDRAVPLEVRG